MPKKLPLTDMPLGTLTAAEYLAAPDDIRLVWETAIKVLTGREKGIERTIRNAQSQDVLADAFAGRWPQDVDDLDDCGNVANCRDLYLEPELARLADVSLERVRAAMLRGGPEAVHGKVKVANMLRDLQAEDAESFPASESSSSGPAPASVSSSAPGLAPGYLINRRYLVKECLGEGGFGSAWLVHDQREKNRPCVVKFANSTDAAENLEKEVELAKGLRHENICAYYLVDDDAHSGLPFVLMEFGGLSVAKAIEVGIKTAVIAKVAAKVAAQGAAGLDAMHAKGLIHGDINPGNILIGSDKLHIRLCDFGIAVAGRRQRLSGSDSTLAATLVGIHEYYSAPEVLLGEDVRSKSDQYSLALVVHCIAENKLRTGRLRRGPVQCSALTPAQNQALTRALDHDPAKRFPSCGDFAKAFCA